MTEPPGAHGSGPHVASHPTSPGRWSTRAGSADWLVLAATAALGALTTWLGSSVIPSSYNLLPASIGWAFVGAAWSFVVMLRTSDRGAWLAAVLLLVGSLATLGLFGPLTLIGFVGMAGGAAPAIALLLVGLSLFGVILAREPSRRLIWLGAPAIVLLTAGLLVSPLPAAIRFAVVEPALTAYVTSFANGETVPMPGDLPIEVGGVPVYDVTREDAGVRLVTSYVGILGDDSAGLFYLRAGQLPSVGKFEHLEGFWYRWFPY